MPDDIQKEILTAWQTYIGRGIILKDKVRPVIARSWERCNSYGLDPWSSELPKCSDTLLKDKRYEYGDFLSLINPVLNYIFSLLNCNISVCDRDGFVFELITPLKAYPRTLGTYIQEANCGNGAITITLEEKIPARADGYEKYRVIAHHYSSVCTPLMINHSFIGAVNATSLFGTLPEKALSLIISAGKLIEYLLIQKGRNTGILEQNPLFQDMIDCSAQSLIIFDQSGVVLAVNQACRNLLGYGSKDVLSNKYLSYFLSSKKDTAYLLEKSWDRRAQREFKFKGLTAGGDQTVIKLQMTQKISVNVSNGEARHLVMFTAASSSASHDKNQEKPVSLYLENIPNHAVRFIGKSPSWEKINELVSITAPYPSSVLLQGETGVGKEVLARTIHQVSSRKGNFVPINCGAIPRELLQSELFGYEGGAFTGARATGSIGKIEHAHEGTLFLDEIGEMPLDMQVTLLRFLQERTITKINSNEAKAVDVRIVAATNKNMYDLVQRKLFREDLYYRLNVIEINIPPLRERVEDIPLLAEFFVEELSKQFNILPKNIAKDVFQLLCQYNWPGNVRELKNVMEKAVVLSRGNILTPEILPEYILHTPRQSKLQANNPEPAKPSSEREHILELLEAHSGNIAQTAKAMHIARNTLYRKLLKYNIKLKLYPIQDDQ